MRFQGSPKFSHVQTDKLAYSLPTLVLPMSRRHQRYAVTYVSFCLTREWLKYRGYCGG